MTIQDIEEKLGSKASIQLYDANSDKYGIAIAGWTENGNRVILICLDAELQSTKIGVSTARVEEIFIDSKYI